MIINGIEFLTIKDTIKLLHCSPATAYKIAEVIGLRIPKPGGRWHIPMTALMRYLTQQTDAQTPGVGSLFYSFPSDTPSLQVGKKLGEFQTSEDGGTYAELVPPKRGD
jgi:hypothetical protein